MKPASRTGKSAGVRSDPRGLHRNTIDRAGRAGRWAAAAKASAAGENWVRV